MSAGGMVYAETGTTESHPGLQGLKERWSKRHQLRESFREKLEAELKSQDEALEKVQKDLKSATTEDKKIEALTAAVNTLIDQRREMHKRMEAFGEKMRQHQKELKEKGSETTTPPVETVP